MVPSCLRRTNLPQPNDLCPVTYWTSPERLIMLLNGCRTAVQLRLPTPATAQARPVLSPRSCSNSPRLVLLWLDSRRSGSPKKNGLEFLEAECNLCLFRSL